MKLNANDLQERLNELDRGYPTIDLWKIPGPYDGPVGCELWLLEPPGPMTGMQESWDLIGKTKEQLPDVAGAGLAAMRAEPQTNLAVTLMGLPLFELDGDSWNVGHYTTKEQVRLRRVMPRGLLLLMKAVLKARTNLNST